MKKITLKEKSTELRLISPRNSQELFSLVDKNRTCLRKWLPWVDATQSTKDTRAFIMNALKKYTSGKEVQFAIYSRGCLVGMLGVHIDTLNKKAELGYWLDKDAQGQGIMTASCKLVILYGFKKLRLNRIEIDCAVRNKKSRAIPQRLGFREEGVQRQAAWLYDHFVDLKSYSLLAREWKNR